MRFDFAMLSGSVANIALHICLRMPVRVQANAFTVTTVSLYLSALLLPLLPVLSTPNKLPTRL